MTDNKNKKAPARSALTLGILGIILAIIMGFFFGIIGAGFSFIIGVIAIILGCRSRKITDKNKGKGGLVTGIITVIFACAVSVVAFIAVDIAHNEANNLGFTMLAEKADSLKFGFIGFACGLSDEDKLNELKGELDAAVRERAQKSSSN